MKDLNKVLGAVENVDGKFNFKLNRVIFDNDNSTVWAKEFAVFMNGRIVEYIVVYMKYYKGRKIVKLDKRRKLNARQFSVYRIVGSKMVYDNDAIFGNAGNVGLYNAYIELIDKLLVL